MVRTKVFVGNLSFATKEAELAKHFEAAGKVISTNIITRGPRSLGYGFVEMESETDAENAVKQLDKKEIDGRPINVEVAKPREENANNNQGQDQSQNQGQQSNRGGNNNRGRGGRRPRGRRPPQGQGQGQQQQDNRPQQQQQNRGQGQGQQQNRGQGQQQNRGGQQQQQQQQQQPRPPRPARQPRPEGEDTRTPSTTTLFVANLPYALEDDAFAKVLKDGNLAYKSAKVSVKKKSGRSKGFGFIEFETETDQQKALAALQGKKINDRDIVVKVALTGNREDAVKTTTGAPADTVAPTNKPSEIKASVTASKQADKPPTPKQEKK